MSLLHKVTLLLGCYDNKIQRQQQKLLLLERKIQHIHQKIDVLDKELQGMKGLLKNMYPQGKRLDRAALYALQRKQSVARRRIANIELEVGQQQQELASSEHQKSLEQELRKRLFRQADKYKNLQLRERKHRGAAIVRQEESEIEEMMTWRK